jgi:hypothetical protein
VLGPDGEPDDTEDEVTTDDMAGRGYGFGCTDADEELFTAAWAATGPLTDWALLLVDKLLKLLETRIQ